MANEKQNTNHLSDLTANGDRNRRAGREAFLVHLRDGDLNRSVIFSGDHSARGRTGGQVVGED